jgi:hypothetical protein
LNGFRFLGQFASFHEKKGAGEGRSYLSAPFEHQILGPILAFGQVSKVWKAVNRDVTCNCRVDGTAYRGYGRKPWIEG